MKRIALLFILCVIAAAAAVGIRLSRSGDRKLQADERLREESAAEVAAAARLGLKTQPLPPDPFERRRALDDAHRLKPDKRFLLAAQELAGGEVAVQFAEGRWILSIGEREIARVPELPDFPELVGALDPLARDWLAAAKVGGKATKVRALRGHRDAFAALREAQTRWSRGDHGAATLHEAASAAAALALEMPRAFDAGDRFDAHAIALCAADAAAGSDVRGQQAVLALALGYRRAARALAPPDEPALRAFVNLDRRGLAAAARRPAANAADRQLLLRWVMEDENEQAFRAFIAAARESEHVSIPAVAQLALHGEPQVVAAASETLPALAFGEVDGVRWTAPKDADLSMALMSAQRSALQNLPGNEDLRGRLALVLREVDTAYDGPLLRAADTTAWYSAVIAAGLASSVRFRRDLRNDENAAAALAEELATWPVQIASDLQRWFKARLAADRGSTAEAYDALYASRVGARAASDLLEAMAKHSDWPVPRALDAVRLARRHFDTRPASRLIWAEVLRVHARDLDRSGRFLASLVDAAPGEYPDEEVGLSRLRGQMDRLEQIALDERFPFPARLKAADALAGRGPKAPAERALRRLAHERPIDQDAQERLIQFLQDTGRSADALSVAKDLVRRFRDVDSLMAAQARCVAARQLDAMGRHQDALETIEPALPSETACVYRMATVQLAALGRKADAEGLLLAHLAHSPTARAVATVAEVRWRSRDPGGAADILAHPPVALTRTDFREIGERFAKAFSGRPAPEVKRAAEAILKAGIQPHWMVELGPPLAKAGAAAQAFELYALLAQVVPAEARTGLQFRAWSALRTAKGAAAAESWLRAQLGPTPPAAVQRDLAVYAYGAGADEVLWQSSSGAPADPGSADRLLLLRAASVVRRGDRGPRRDALLPRRDSILEQILDVLERWEARVARYAGIPSAQEGWELRLMRYVLGQGQEEDLAQEATEGARPCEAPYYFGVRAAAESRPHDAAVWYRVAMECRNPEQPEAIWAHQAVSQMENDRSFSTNPLQAAR